MSKAKYWILTIPQHEFTPFLPQSVEYIRGQLERGDGGFLHWQLLCILSRQSRLSAVRKIFGPFHAEPSRSQAADAYVWKEETRVEGTQFELGSRPFRRNNDKDWAQILESAKAGDMDAIPADVLIRCYGNIQKIAVSNARPVSIERRCKVYWGVTGSGKSHTAWSEATLDAYPKDPNTKFWDGYRGQSNVVIDEFRGKIDISHLLRWLDRYPVLVEVKGSSVVFKAENVWITSNLHPKDWYAGLDEATLDALLRRLDITHYSLPFQ